MLATTRRNVGPEHPDTLNLMLNLANLSPALAEDSKPGVSLAREVDEITRRTHPEVCLARFLHEFEGQSGRWGESAQLCRSALDKAQNPEEVRDISYEGAITALAAGETNLYQTFVGKMLSVAPGITNSEMAHKVCEVYCLHPHSLGDEELVRRLAELGSTNEFDLDGKLARGMAEYRRGNLEQSLKWLRRRANAPATVPGAEAAYFRAMIFQRRGHTNEATLEMVYASNQLREATRSGFTGTSWQDYVRAAAVRLEAEQLVFGRPVSTNITPEEIAETRSKWIPIRHHLNLIPGLAVQKKWESARIECLAAIQDPLFDWDNADAFAGWPVRMALPFLMANDLSNHSRLCHEWFKWLESHAWPWNAVAIIEASLIRETPSTGFFVEEASKYVNSAKSIGTEGAWPWAIFAYRSGQFADVLVAEAAAKDSTQLTSRQGTRIFKAMALASWATQRRPERS